jgi:SHS2 domain-containing protein
MTRNRPVAGHWCVPGVSRTRVEAWAPTRERCIAEAVAGTVESFAEPAGAAPARFHRMTVPGADDPEVLHGVLDEVLFDISGVGVVPVWIRVRDLPAGVELEVGGVDTKALRPGGRAPRTVKNIRLRPGGDRSGWRASIVLAR